MINKMLTCGSYDAKKKVLTRSGIGTPQGNVASPVLANIVLDKLDKFLLKYKDNFSQGKARRLSREYISLRNRRRYTKDVEEKREL